MTQFIQLHVLTSYPPANLNRDDLGRPKTAKMGGVDRLRVSSQSLKRAWRTSELFQLELNNNLGKRTKLFGVDLFKYFIDKNQSFENSLEWSKAIAGLFGKLESAVDLKKKKDNEKETLHKKLEKKWRAYDSSGLGIADYSLEKLNQLEALEISQLCFLSPEEETAAFGLADSLIQDNNFDYEKNLDILRSKTRAVDIAMFGRMLADSPSKNFDAACQVAHALSVHSVVIEDDYFTAVDDLNDHSVDAGAAHIGETGFAAGLFYSYICINRDLLVENLDGDEQLARNALGALVEAVVKISPEGKQNSFGSRAYASYVLAERGNQQPRSLSVAYLKPVEQSAGDDFIVNSVDRLRSQAINFDKAYEPCADSRIELFAHGNLDVGTAAQWPTGGIKELLAFIVE